VADVASAYMLSSLSITAERTWPDVATAPGNEIARLRSLRVCNEHGQTIQVADIRSPVIIEMVYDVVKPGHPLAPWCEFFNEAGTCLFVGFDMKPGWRDRPWPMGRFASTVRVPGNLLAEGTVLVGVRLHSPRAHLLQYREKDAVAFQVMDNLNRLDGTSVRGEWEGRIPGVVRPLLEWTRTSVSSNITL
jgi:lipopolysaccharide transport system ATP-binding protein